MIFLFFNKFSCQLIKILIHKFNAFSLFEENGHYRVTTYRKTYRGTIQTETYQISEQDGNLFIETGLSVLLTYDKENDRILLSPGGEYKRGNQPIKK